MAITMTCFMVVNGMMYLEIRTPKMCVGIILEYSVWTSPKLWMTATKTTSQCTIRKRCILEARRRGEVITACCHLNNPLTGGDSWDNSNTRVVSEILPKGERSAKQVQDLARSPSCFCRRIERLTSYPYHLPSFPRTHANMVMVGNKLYQPLNLLPFEIHGELST